MHVINTEKSGKSTPANDAAALQPLMSAAAWKAADMADSSRWTHVLTDAEKAELEELVATVKSQKLDIINLERGDIALPALAPRLSKIREEIYNGRGFALIRGFPVERFDRSETMIAYLALGLHFGEPVSQNGKGHLIGHVTDLGLDYRTDAHVRPYQTRLEMQPHTDSCDIVGLLTLNGGKSGGLSQLASSVALCNAMLERCPELAEELSQPVYWDRRGEVPAGKAPYYQLPIFHCYDGYLTTIYGPPFLYVVTRHPEVPPLTERRKAAYEMLEKLALDDEFRIDMTLQRGDVQFVLNHVILHTRTEYEDYDDPTLKRHLLRLWLSAPESRPLPQAFEERYGPIVPGKRRGGIMVPGVPLKIPLDPE